MDQLQEFMDLLTGNFNNAEQFNRKKQGGSADFPFARHCNTVCNHKIKNLPENFKGIFLVEESYYTVGDSTRASSHLFLFTQEEQRIKLTSYEIPDGCDKNTFSYESMPETEYTSLKQSEKFSPAFYEQKDGVWEGGSVSMFSPVLKFTLFERFSPQKLEVSETMEVNGKRTLGYDEPIIYVKV